MPKKSFTVKLDEERIGWIRKRAKKFDLSQTNYIEMLLALDQEYDLIEQFQPVEEIPEDEALAMIEKLNKAGYKISVDPGAVAGDVTSLPLVPPQDSGTIPGQTIVDSSPQDVKKMIRPQTFTLDQLSNMSKGVMPGKAVTVGGVDPNAKQQMRELQLRELEEERRVKKMREAAGGQDG